MAQTKDAPRIRQVPAVTRAIAILRQLGRSDEPLGVNQMARDLELVPSTVLHILRVLTEEGLVAFDPKTKRYFLGVGILSIARSAIQRNSFAAQIQPRLDELAERFGVTGIATQLTDSSHMIVVALSQLQQPFRLQVDMGSRFPALISATGRCFAAYNGLSTDELREKFDRLKWDNPPSFDTWMEQVEAARKNGYAIDQGNYISGVTVMAVPFLNAAGRMVESMVAIGITERIEAAGMDNLAKAMLKIRNEVAVNQIQGGPVGG